MSRLVGTRVGSLFHLLIGAALALTLLAVYTSPALAHHKANHGGGSGKARAGTGGGQAKDHDGDADSNRATRHTEDTDSNDNGTPNNQSDAGDNKHPSGKDRSVERGGSGNQGNSESDPDDDGRGPDRSNGGPDKPNGSGGEDLADQDGNNGCGNDDDFEDDNEGWCGKHKTKEAPVKAEKSICTKGDEMKGAEACGKDEEPGDADVEAAEVAEAEAVEDETTVEAAVAGVIENAELIPDEQPAGDEVLGAQIARDDEVAPAAERVAQDDAVAGELASRSATESSKGGALPFTGVQITTFIVLALGLIGGGLFLARVRRS